MTDLNEIYLRVLRDCAAKAVGRKNSPPTAEVAEQAVQLALSRRKESNDGGPLHNLFHRCLREITGAPAGAPETKKKRRSNCPPEGRRVFRSGKPFGG